jgi:hypothetical protein
MMRISQGCELGMSLIREETQRLRRARLLALGDKMTLETILLNERMPPRSYFKIELLGDDKGRITYANELYV